MLTLHVAGEREEAIDIKVSCSCQQVPNLESSQVIFLDFIVDPLHSRVIPWPIWFRGADLPIGSQTGVRSLEGAAEQVQNPITPKVTIFENIPFVF